MAVILFSRHVKLILSRRGSFTDGLLPNFDAVDGTVESPTSAATFDVEHGARFRVGDQVRLGDGREIMLVTAVSGNTITVSRGYGGTTPDEVADGVALRILGNAALEGDTADAARFPAELHADLHRNGGGVRVGAGGKADRCGG